MARKKAKEKPRIDPAKAKMTLSEVATKAGVSTRDILDCVLIVFEEDVRMSRVRQMDHNERRKENEAMRNALRSENEYFRELIDNHNLSKTIRAIDEEIRVWKEEADEKMRLEKEQTMAGIPESTLVDE